MREAVNERQRASLKDMHEVLGGDFWSLSVRDYEVSERFDQGECELSCSVQLQPSGEMLQVKGQGVGMVDAFFQGVCAHYEAEHPSLSSLRFTSFGVKGLMNEEGLGSQASDAQAEARIGVTNSYGKEFEFTAVTPSVSRSSLEAVLGAIEYFLNSERAYVKTYVALKQAETDQRVDLVTKYTALLASMVRNTAHSEAIDRLKGGA